MKISKQMKEQSHRKAMELAIVNSTLVKRVSYKKQQQQQRGQRGEA